MVWIITQAFLEIYWIPALASQYARGWGSFSGKSSSWVTHSPSRGFLTEAVRAVSLGTFQLFDQSLFIYWVHKLREQCVLLQDNVSRAQISALSLTIFQVSVSPPVKWGTAAAPKHRGRMSSRSRSIDRCLESRPLELCALLFMKLWRNTSS